MKGQGNRLGLGSLQRSVALFGPVPEMHLPKVKDYLQILHTTQGCREIKRYRISGSTVQVTGVPPSACSEL